MTAEDAKSFFSRELLLWYRASKRDLPWRRSRDPYRIWVSEVMLQQTRVETVIPYYERFMERFPTAVALAEAPEEEVLKLWEGLGYYSRARNLQAGAREVAELYGGAVPDDKEAVARLKGVGPYTAGAIMSIAFNRPEPAVDGNVMRVLSRYFCLEDDIAKPSTRKKIERLAVLLIPEGAASDFNQGLMELGALVCTPKSPGCLTCPVMAQCAGRLAGKERELPVKTKAKPPRPELRLAALIVGTGPRAGQVLVRRRPDRGLLARMWELPHIELAKGSSETALFGGNDDAVHRQLARRLAAELMRETGLPVRPLGWREDAEHVFSHIHWHMRVYTAELDSSGAFRFEGDDRTWIAAEAAGVYDAGLFCEDEQAAPLLAAAAGDLPPGYRWIGPEDMGELAFPNLFLRILNAYWQQEGNADAMDDEMTNGGIIG